MAKIGRPRVFDDPKTLLKLSEKYYKECQEEGKPFLVIGLCNYLGIHRDRLNQYREYPEFHDTIKTIYQMAEEDLVIGAMSGKWNPTVSIFLAKNNHKYTDKTEIEQTTHGVTQVQIVEDKPENT